MIERKNLKMLIIYYLGYIFIFPLFAVLLSQLFDFIKLIPIQTLSLLVTLSLLLYVDPGIFKNNFNNQTVKEIGKWFIYLAMIMFTMSFIKSGLNLNSSTNQTSVVASIENQSVFYLINIAILSPLVEEIIYRYTWKNIIKKDYLYLLISSVLFSAFHLISEITTFSFDLSFTINLLSYFSMGLIIGLSYIRTKNIFVPIVIHMLWNTFLLILLLL